MIANFNTKPLQGALFYFSDKIMGVKPEDFKKHKDNNVKILKPYDLYFDKDDLYDI